MTNDNSLETEQEKCLWVKTRVNLQLAERIYFYKRKDFTTIDEWINATCDELLNRLKYLNKKFFED